MLSFIFDGNCITDDAYRAHVEIALACGRLDKASGHILFMALPIYKWKDGFSDGCL